MGELRPLLDAVCRGRILARAEAREAMDLLVAGAAPEPQAAAFLGALAARGPRAEELAGFAEALRRRALAVDLGRAEAMDTCGTGGDGLHTFNFSTAAALVAAGAGAAVAKHGNRAVSSRSGSADVLEALGVAVDTAPEEARRSLKDASFAFLYAPRYHPALAAVGSLRRALGVRTVFNLLGPLLNPALVRRQVVGIFDPGLLETYGRVLLDLGSERVMVVCAEDGMDELSPAGATRVCHADSKQGLRLETVRPEDAGLGRVDLAAVKGGDAAENARRLEALLAGQDGPLLPGTLLNAAAALVVAGLARDLRAGAVLARESVAKGRAKEVLERLRRLKGGRS